MNKLRADFAVINISTFPLFTLPNEDCARVKIVKICKYVQIVISITYYTALEAQYVSVCVVRAIIVVAYYARTCMRCISASVRANAPDSSQHHNYQLWAAAGWRALLCCYAAPLCNNIR